MTDMNQPNLQAILDNYGYRMFKLVTKIEGKEAKRDYSDKSDKEAIDAIYAGMLAVIGEDEPDIPIKHYSDGGALVQINPVNPVKAKQRQALKRWCYGDTK